MRNVSFFLALMGAAMGVAGCSRSQPEISNYANDRAEIENLQARYLFALDFNDGKAYAAVFAPDGELDWANGVIKGRENIVNETQVMKDKFSKGSKNNDKASLRHFITSNVIEVKGDHATGRAYWFEFFNDVPAGAEPVVHAYGHSEDEYRKIDGHWYWARRKIFNEMMPSRLAPAVNPAGSLGK